MFMVIQTPLGIWCDNHPTYETAVASAKAWAQKYPKQNYGVFEQRAAFKGEIVVKEVS